jgi:hypothetical protein
MKDSSIDQRVRFSHFLISIRWQTCVLIHIAVFAAFLRAKAPKYWRAFHALMYGVLFFGIVHANLIGGDFQNLGIMVIFNSLFVVSLAGFAFKRYRSYQLKKKMSR